VPLINVVQEDNQNLEKRVKKEMINIILR